MIYDTATDNYNFSVNPNLFHFTKRYLNLILIIYIIYDYIFCKLQCKLLC